MSRWREVVRRELTRYHQQTGVDVVELSELYEQFLPTLRREFPENGHPRAKLRQVLQQLHDRDELSFVSPGTYRLVDAQGDAAGVITGSGPEYVAREYETTVGARSMPIAFRNGVLARYGATCPVSGVDHPRLLDVAHVLPWSEFPARRTDVGNVLPLSRTHHAAFDAGLFTLDPEFRLRVAPEFDTESDLLRRTLLDREGDPVELPEDAPLSERCLRRHNDRLDWQVA
ncbi:HNH endonuclease [Halobium salinum]|uniref:HNH endonuclease n=1 Tax=Halobium salinum TaxID=1364940 RepID=A0ABD5PBK8_9EURY|nr:HNH endonuclease [Halobium salinum]